MTQTQCSIGFLASVFRTRSFVRVRFVTLWSIWQSIKPENEVSSILMNFCIFSHVTVESQAEPSLNRWSWQDVFMCWPDWSIYTSCITVTLRPHRRNRTMQADEWVNSVLSLLWWIHFLPYVTLVVDCMGDVSQDSAHSKRILLSSSVQKCIAINIWRVCFESSEEKEFGIGESVIVW